jgi:hypothetical protein
MKNNVAAGNDPWTTEFHILQNNSLASSTFTPTYYSTVCRGDTTSCPNGHIGDGDLKNSASAAYLNALEWYITGNTAYANEAIAICEASKSPRFFMFM